MWKLISKSLREARSLDQLRFHPLRVTLDARNIAAEFMAKMDLMERMPKSLSIKGPSLP